MNVVPCYQHQSVGQNHSWGEACLCVFVCVLGYDTGWLWWQREVEKVLRVLNSTPQTLLGGKPSLVQKNIIRRRKPVWCPGIFSPVLWSIWLQQKRKKFVHIDSLHWWTLCSKHSLKRFFPTFQCKICPYVQETMAIRVFSTLNFLDLWLFWLSHSTLTLNFQHSVIRFYGAQNYKYCGNATGFGTKSQNSASLFEQHVLVFEPSKIRPSIQEE